MMQNAWKQAARHWYEKLGEERRKVATLQLEVEALKDPAFWDATDGASADWWRGYQHATKEAETLGLSRDLADRLRSVKALMSEVKSYKPWVAQIDGLTTAVALAATSSSDKSLVVRLLSLAAYALVWRELAMETDSDLSDPLQKS